MAGKDLRQKSAQRKLNMLAWLALICENNTEEANTCSILLPMKLYAPLTLSLSCCVFQFLRDLLCISSYCSDEG